MKVVVDANFTGIQCNGTDVHTYVCRLCTPQWWTVNLKVTPASTGTYHWWPLSKPFQSTQGRGPTQEYTAILCVETTIEFLRKRLVPVLWSGPLVTTLHCVHYKYTTYNLLWLHLTSHPKTLVTILYVCSHNIVIWTSKIYDRITTMGFPREEVKVSRGRGWEFLEW